MTASHITSLTIVCLTVYSGADQRKHQSSASLAFVRGIHWWPVNSPHKPSWGEFTDDRWISRTKASKAENVSIWWRHRVPGPHPYQRSGLHNGLSVALKGYICRCSITKRLAISTRCVQLIIYMYTLETSKLEKWMYVVQNIHCFNLNTSKLKRKI